MFTKETLITMLFFFFVLPSLFYVPFAAADSNPDEPSLAIQFVQAECRATRYPALCVQCLSTYANTIHLSHRLLAETALSVSLSRTKSAAVFISKLARKKGLTAKQHAAVGDCMENMVDTVDQLSRSMKEVGAIGGAGQEFKWHVSNVQTWVSGALTDETTCVEGLTLGDEHGNVKDVIKKRVIGCAQVTSNALALLNRFVSR